MGFKNKIKSIIFWGLNLAFNIFPLKEAAVLMYHSVGNNSDFSTVRPKEFQKQMNYLKRKKYNVVSLSELTGLLRKKNIPPKTVVLTFDDGAGDNFLNVFPVLKEYNFPATFFVATGFIREKIPNPQNILVDALNWDQIEEMEKSDLIDFEPHTVNHPKLPEITLVEAKKEIIESKKVIEKRLNKKCKFFAYPKGRYNQQTQEILKKNNFEVAFILGEDLVSGKDHPLFLNRISIDSSTDLWQFKGKLNFTIKVFNFLKKFYKI